MGNLDYLKNDGVEEGELDKLNRLVQAYEMAEGEVNRLAEALKEVKEAFNQVSQVDIPNFLLSHGLSELKTADGKKIVVKQKVSASVTDIEAFYVFLKSRHEEDLVKTTMELGRLPPKVVTEAKKRIHELTGTIPETKNTIHPMTLAKWVKDTCGIGSDDGGEINVTDLPECVKAFVYNTTTIKN